MSKGLKQLIKDAKQAFGEKQFKIAEEKCHVSDFIHVCVGCILRVCFFFIGSSQGRSKKLFRQFIAGSNLSRE